MFVDNVIITSFKEKEILALIGKSRHLSLVDIVSIHDYIAFLGLSEDMIEYYCSKLAAGDKIMKDLPGAYAWELA